MTKRKSRTSRKYIYTLRKKNTSTVIWPFKCTTQIPNPFHLLLFAFVIIICFVFTFTAISANENPQARPDMIVGSSKKYGPSLRVNPNPKMRPFKKITTSSTSTSIATSTLLTLSMETIMTTDVSQFEMNENGSQQQSNTKLKKNIESVPSNNKPSQAYIPILSQIDQVPGYSHVISCYRVYSID